MGILAGDVVAFPNNAVDLVAGRFATLDPDIPAEHILKRPLRNTDPNISIGVFATLWLPDENSMEMKGTGFHDPTVDTYTLGVQGFVKDMDEERGLASHSVLSEMIRTMLYRDDPLRVGLAALSTSIGGVTKRYRRSGIRTQRYLSNELDGSWLYLSTLEFWLETEST
jgi:hypothetical protein